MTSTSECNCNLQDGDMFQCWECDMILTHKETMNNSLEGSMGRCYCDSIFFRSVQ